MQGFEELIGENTDNREECNLCKESFLGIGEKTDYGATIIFHIGKGPEDKWFATLSPKTGGNPEKDFTIQLMPSAHLTHFSQVSQRPELAKNYGIAFSKLANAMAKAMAMENPEFRPIAKTRDLALSIATYGKCTNWQEKKEHLHIKLFPFRGNMGQPYTVDSSFARKEVFKEGKTGKDFVKMSPVNKTLIPEKRLEELSQKLIKILSEAKK